ncbi:hypothetical protein AXF42_Ash021443 [Apostasia shenzhenica]|uniref:Reverse transcriptase domain-containing protein n=1 Tax=Apostasia shenzhenica TaxID=1088818 RepID=A0A2H9ZYE8_9ASPA|nr:hypothetical protein AXF42_Ash021443 [Apostasia shenzhenica]
MIRRDKKKAFESIKDRIIKRTDGWKECLLIIDMMKIMIKAMAQATLMYAMSIFKLPTTLCSKIESAIA